MEFLMTYGWAILVLIVVVAVLFYIGVLNPKNTQTNTFFFTPGFSAYSFIVGNGTGALALDFGQALGRSIVVIGISCSQNSSAAMRDLDNPIDISTGEHRWVTGGNSNNTVFCTGEDGQPLSSENAQLGERYRGKVCMHYMETDTSMNRTVCGDISARFEVAPTPGPTATPGGSPTPGGTETPTPTPTPSPTPPPVVIVGGNPPTQRQHYETGAPTDYTFIDTNNPFNGTGTLATCQAYAGASCNIKMKVFRDGGDNWVFVGESGTQSLAPGLNTFSCSMAVQAGDYIGVWESASQCVYYDQGGTALYMRPGDVTSTTGKGEWASPPVGITFSIYATSAGGAPTPTPTPIPTPTPTPTPGPVILASGQNHPQFVAVDGTNVYWDENVGGNVKKIHLDGSGEIATLASGLSTPNALVIDGSYVYWAESQGGTVKRVPIGGGTPPDTLASGQNGPAGIAVDGSYIYWSEFSGGTVKKASKVDGSGQTTLASGLNAPTGVTVDGSYVYWGEFSGGTVKRASKADGSGQITLASGLNGVNMVIVDSTYVYWDEAMGTGVVKKASKADGSGLTILASGLSGPAGLAIDGSYAYWAEQSGNIIRKAPLDGGGPTTTLASGRDAPGGVAIDGSYVYWAEWGSGHTPTSGNVVKVAK